MVTKAYKVYGRDGHRQGASFLASVSYEIRKKDTTVLIVIENADLTGTHNYSLVTIIAESAEECRDILEAQISDGYFENHHVGRVEEIA